MVGVFHSLAVIADGLADPRPPALLSNDPDDSSSITPNSLLSPLTETTTTTTTLPPSSDPPPPILLHRWRHVHSLADAFWKRFQKEYVSTLQKRRKWTATRRNVAIGDLVLVSENNPRDEWGLARVINTFPDREGQVRRVYLKTAKGKELERHINSLVLLEATDEQLAPGEIKPAPSVGAACITFYSPSEINMTNESQRSDSHLIA